MLAIGRPEPEISQITGPYVRVSLVGGTPDPETVEFLATLEPAATASDIDALLIIDHLTTTGWIDAATAMPVLQRPESEARAAILRLASAKSGRDTVLLPVKGVPPGQQEAYRLSLQPRSPTTRSPYRPPGNARRPQSPTGRLGK